MTPGTQALGWVALLLGGLSAAALVWAVATAVDSPLHRLWRQYTTAVQRQLRLLHSEEWTGVKFARVQALVIGVLVVASLALGELIPALIAVPVAVLPWFLLTSRVDERREQIDKQLSQFLTVLSNALKASPSLGEALSTTARLMRPPLSQDIEDALKEYQLGVPLDQALVNLSARIESRSLTAAMATLLIGRQMGGDLPKLLDRTADTLREMMRLEGVVRTKTAEGKSQAFVLGAIPFFIVLAISFVDEHWFEPLRNGGFAGYTVVGVAAGLWLAGVFTARRVLDVDI